MTNNEWFNTWFDSPYYHLLYKDRDYAEAKNFIDNLITYFKISSNHKVLDLACGKGRYAIYLNKKGFDVVGLDLSSHNIKSAKKYENKRLKFYIHDMREVFAENEFDFVLNVFTSFGYFETEQENEKAICAAAKALKPNGKMLIDFLNPYTVINNMVKQEVKVKDGITFNIHKSYSDGFIEKNIYFNADGEDHHFKEKVQAIRQVEFLDYFRSATLKLKTTFGSYELTPYHAETSERMIFIVEK